MNSHRCCTRQLLVLLLIISSIVTTFALAADDSEKAGVLQFTAHPDGTFSVISQSAPLEMLLSRIRETTNVDIYIDGASKKRPVSINVKNISLIQC